MASKPIGRLAEPSCYNSDSTEVVVAKKWYSFFVVTDDADAATDSSVASAPTGTVAPRRASELVPDAVAEVPAAVVTAAGPVDLSVVYESAKIAPPAHGYSVLKVAEMLQSEHIRALPADVKRKSVMVALDAAGVKVDDIVEDAVRRDRALDTYERVLQQHVDQLDGQIASENRQIEEEIASRAAELRARIEENNQKVAGEKAELLAWRARKHQEEAAIADAVGYFVTENPITTTARPVPAKGESDVR